MLRRTGLTMIIMGAFLVPNLAQAQCSCSQQPSNSQSDFASIGRNVNNPTSFNNFGTPTGTGGSSFGTPSSFLGQAGKLVGGEKGTLLSQAGSFASGSLNPSSNTAGNGQGGQSGGYLSGLTNMNMNQYMALASAGAVVYGSVTNNKAALGVGAGLAVGSQMNFSNGIDKNNLAVGTGAVLTGAGVANDQSSLTKWGERFVKVGDGHNGQVQQNNNQSYNQYPQPQQSAQYPGQYSQPQQTTQVQQGSFQLPSLSSLGSTAKTGFVNGFLNASAPKSYEEQRLAEQQKMRDNAEVYRIMKERQAQKDREAALSSPPNENTTPGTPYTNGGGGWF